MINFSVLKDVTRLKKYLSGTTIFEGIPGVNLHIVLKGEVGVFHNEPDGSRKLLATVGPGGFFGEMALPPEAAASRAAIALSEVIALPVGRGDAAAFIRGEPELAHELLKELCKRLTVVSVAYEQLAGHPFTEAAHAAPAARPAAAPSPAPAAGPAPAAPAAKAAPKPAAKPSAPSPLFPEGHGSYTLAFNADDRTYLMDSSYTCPMCKKEFTALRVRGSRLQVESVDSDMRSRYKGVEPLYFDVVTCPHCLYSALNDSFKSPDLLKADLSEVRSLLPHVKIQTGAQTDTYSIFAGYYLALLCAPKCFAKHHQVTAKLLLKLSRVYQDCGDTAMERAVSKRALDAYMHVYINEDSSPEIDQQLCLIIGELYLKLDDAKNARDFLFKAKTNREGTQVLRTQAENRLGEIRAGA